MTETATKSMKIIFESTTCLRCSGSGAHGPKIVQGGVCFGCKGSGKILTRNGARALKAHQDLLTERMGTPAEEITEGSRVYTPADLMTRDARIVTYPWNWRTVHSATMRSHTTTDTATGETTTYRAVHIRFDDNGKGHMKSAPEGEPLLIITPNREVLREIMREVANRFKGAWLDGEEPPAKPAPRLRKTTDMPAEDKPAPKSEPRTFPNRYAGDCVRPGCGQRVEAGKGECYRDGGRYVTRHAEGQCPAPVEEPAPAETAPAPVGTESDPVVVITRAQLYPEVARPGPAWVWSYHYYVNGGPVCQYGTGLSSLRDMLRRKFGRAVRIIETWKPRDPAPAAPAEERPPVTEPGMYRHGGVIYRVQETRDSGRLYAKKLTRAEDGKGAEFEYAPGAVHRLSAVDRMTVDEAADVGREWSVCIVCTAELSNPESIARGMGPVCAKRV